MADVNVPFASNAGRRSPTADEKLNGFPCGPADQFLFNGLFYRIEAELRAVIVEAGLSPTDTNMGQVRDAIKLLIDAATGGGETESYVLLSQAAARLPIFPEIYSADGRINITSPAAGSVRIPGGVDFMHRGIIPYTTAETDFATQPSKTYHVRWNPTDGYSLQDLTNVGYNPSALLETNSAFDSTYDDMLMARVVTNSSNVATITTLANTHDLALNKLIAGTDLRLGGLNGANALVQDTFNWSRTPRNKSLTPVRAPATLASNDLDWNFYASSENRNANGASYTSVIPVSRYGLDAVFMRDGMSALPRLNLDVRA